LLTVISFFSEGHVLIEDIPGVGKTVLALTLAKSIGLKFGRIQCTSDLLPSDITGFNVFKKEKSAFEFIKGPIFNDIVLVDEINRAMPKTQSAFLEAMEERQVSIENATFKLSPNFFIIATQNPLEHYGTYPLPDSQLDRFIMKFSIGYPEKEIEKKILKEGDIKKEIFKISPYIEEKEVFHIKNEINKVKVSEKILTYLVDIAEKTRKHNDIYIGLSTRALLDIVKCAKTYAFYCNRDFVIPEDIKFLSRYVFSHRIVLKSHNINQEILISEIINEVQIPY